MQTTTLEREAPTIDLAPENETFALVEPLAAMIQRQDGAPGSTAAGQWTLKNDAVVDMTIDSTLAMGTAMGAHISAQHATYRELRAEIAAAPDAETATGVTWPTPP